MPKMLTDDEWRVRLTETYVKLDSETGCVLWTGRINRKGYGEARYQRRDVRAHRLAWHLFVGPIPEGLFVCHKCDVRNCVNTEHLWLGTQIDNDRDMRAKNRHVVLRGKTKLTEEDVRGIRSMHSTGAYTYEALAKKFGVSPDAVSLVARGLRWGHVDNRATEASPDA